MKEKIYDAISGEETWRDYTKKELAEVETAEEAALKRIAEFEARKVVKSSARAKLIALGLTEDEIDAL